MNRREARAHPCIMKPGSAESGCARAPDSAVVAAGQGPVQLPTPVVQPTTHQTCITHPFLRGVCNRFFC